MSKWVLMIVALVGAMTHPENWSLMEYLGVLYAMRETWPCAKSQAQ